MCWVQLVGRTLGYILHNDIFFYFYDLFEIILPDASLIQGAEELVNVLGGVEEGPPSAGVRVGVHGAGARVSCAHEQLMHQLQIVLGDTGGSGLLGRLDGL